MSEFLERLALKKSLSRESIQQTIRRLREKQTQDA